ncbi:uncharacterized protein LOC135706310 [Ochlerotatus camptorhynchus]|uniref:uncharacterized protein LOC135706310 n=1 Tax=Ochlerotatus camptorhynchus TaxID=644619 RepID=UPI0031CF0BF1
MSVKLVLVALAVAVSSSPTAALPVGDSSDSDEDLIPINTLERQCLLRTGSTETFEQLMSGFSFVPICFAGHLDLDGLSDDLEVLNDTNRVQFFDKYCPQVNESLQCVNPMLELLRKCWDGEELAFLDIMINLLPEALNLICKGHGEIFFRLDGPEYEKCLDKFDDYAIECAGKMSNTTEAMYLSKFGEIQCGELRDFRGCISDKLDSCKAQGVIDLVDLFYRPVVKASPCKKFINLEEHKAVETNEI